MRITKNRFFNNTVTGLSFMEKIEWLLAGTGITGVDDPRAVSIGESRNHPVTGIPGFDLWIPFGICNCGATLIGIDHIYNTEPVMNLSANGQASLVNKRTTVRTFTRMDIYAQPLKPDTIEISMNEYNTNMASISP